MTDGVSRAKQRSPQSIRHLFTITPFQLEVWKIDWAEIRGLW
jgi:hypothetical protein